MKKIKVLILIIFLIGYSNIGKFGATEINNALSRSEPCFETKLNFDKSTVSTGGQVRVELTYMSITPACTTEELNGQTIEIDFTDLIDKPLSDAINTELKETNHFVPTIDGNKLVLTFKDLSDLLEEGEGLENFWGKYSIVIKVKNVDEETPVTITDNVTGEANIDILAPNIGTGGYDNTEKWSEVDYASVGDDILYTVRLNNEWKSYDVINMSDKMPRGMSLIVNDPEHPIEVYRQISSMNHWQDNSAGLINNSFTIDASETSLKITNNEPLDYGIVIKYWVHVDSEVATGEYHNIVDVSYDGRQESVDYLVEQNGDSETGEIGAGSYLDLYKEDQFGNSVSGAEFAISDGTRIIETLVTDENGYVKSMKHPYGSYMVYETKAPEGYSINPQKYIVDFVIDEEVVHVNDSQPIINELDTGQIALYKTDEEATPLEGAEFTIYDSERNLIETIRSNDEGYAISNELPLGDYTVVETNAPEGYILDEKEYAITIEKNDEVFVLNDGEAIINKSMQDPSIELPGFDKREGQVELNKVDEDGKNLSGAEFTIYDEENQVIEVLVTDENGYAKSSNLKFGSYYLVETKAPEGYQLDSTKYEFAITESRELTAVNGGEAIVNYKENTTEPEVVDPTEPDVVYPIEPEVVDPTEPDVVYPAKPEVVDPIEKDTTAKEVILKNKDEEKKEVVDLAENYVSHSKNSDDVSDITEKLANTGSQTIKLLSILIILTILLSVIIIRIKI